MSNLTPVFTKDESGHWVTTAPFPSWIGFRALSRAHLQGGSEAYATGTAEITFLPADERADGPTETDVQSAAWVIEHEAEISVSLFSSLLKEYPLMRERYEFLGDELTVLMPEVNSVDDLRKLIGFQGVFVHTTQKDGIPYVGFCFDCSWDDEHGLGVLMHGTRVVEIGGMDTTFLWWIPVQDAEK